MNPAAPAPHKCTAKSSSIVCVIRVNKLFEKDDGLFTNDDEAEIGLYAKEDIIFFIASKSKQL